MTESKISKELKKVMQEEVNDEMREAKETLLAEMRKKAAAKLGKDKKKIEEAIRREPKKKLKRKEVSMVISEGELFEQVWNPEEGSRFVALNDGDAKFYDVVDGNCPIESDAIEKGAVLLPENPEDYGTFEGLVCDIRNHIHKYLDIPEDYEIFATYYIMLTWVSDKITTIGYLRVIGDLGTGKSRFLNVIGRLLYKPCKISGAVTPAPIYRMIEKWRGSLIVDEADFSKSDEKNEVVTILNCGIERGNSVMRCDKDDPDDIKFFDAFGAKVVGGRKRMSDAAFESRCLRHISKQTKRKDIPRVLPNKFFKEEMSLRNRLLKFRFDYYKKIDPDVYIDFSFGEVEPRIEQISLCFIPLLANAPEMLEKFKEFVADYGKKLVIERSESFDGLIMKKVVKLLLKREEKISSSDIAEIVNKKRQEKNHISPVVIGRHLRALGFDFKPTRIVGVDGVSYTKRIFTYKPEDFLDVIKRFIPEDSLEYENITKIVTDEVTDVTDITDVTGVLKDNLKNLDTSHTNNEVTGSTIIIKEKKGSPITSVTSVTSVTPRFLGLIPKDGINAQDLVEQAISEKIVPITNPGIGYELIDKLKSEGLIYEPHPGRLEKV